MSSTSSRFFGIVLSLGMALGTLLVIGVALSDAKHSEAAGLDILTAAVAAGLYLLLLRGPLGKTIARMLDNSTPDDQILRRLEDVEELLSRESVDHARLLELEERLDFAERLMSQSSGVPLLPQRRTDS
jgi:hypothetical protein